MPEAVKTYLATNDATLVRQVQNNILTIYRSDMSKHVSPNEATRISMVWQSIPSQLAKENKKFIYGAVRSGARANSFYNNEKIISMLAAKEEEVLNGKLTSFVAAKKLLDAYFSTLK